VPTKPDDDARRAKPAIRQGRPRRDAIIDEAARLFAARGFHGVGVDDIGAAVGISGPGIYRHFASKDAMLVEMLVGISERLLHEGTRRVSAATDPSEALDALVRWHVDFALDNPELIVVQDRDLDSLPADARRRVRRLQRQYVELWVDVIDAHQPGHPRAEVRAAAHAIFGLLNSTPHSASTLERELMAALLRRMALAGLDGLVATRATVADEVFATDDTNHADTNTGADVEDNATDVEAEVRARRERATSTARAR
jgi:AcrR family transcriptional regulator